MQLVNYMVFYREMAGAASQPYFVFFLSGYQILSKSAKLSLPQIGWKNFGRTNAYKYIESEKLRIA